MIRHGHSVIGHDERNGAEEKFFRSIPFILSVVGCMRTTWRRWRAESTMTALALLLQAIVAVALAAQTPDTTTRAGTASSDTSARDTARAHAANPDAWLLLPVMGGLGAVLAVAPSSLLLVPRMTSPGTGTVPFARNHVAVYSTIGISYDGREGWLRSEHLELFRNAVYAEIEAREYYLPALYATRTVRVGYLAHPKSALVGGVTLGYRYAAADTLRRGVEVGFPLIFGDEDAIARFEPTYLFSARDGVSWNYRFQGEFPIPLAPLFAGFVFEWQRLGKGNLSSVPLELLVGARF